MATSTGPGVRTEDFTVSTSAVEIVSEQRSPEFVRTVFITTDGDVFLGGSDVTADTGLLLGAADDPLCMTLPPYATLHAIAASGRDVRVLQLEG